MPVGKRRSDNERSLLAFLTRVVHNLFDIEVVPRISPKGDDSGHRFAESGSSNERR